MPKKMKLAPVRAAWAGNNQWKIDIPSRVAASGSRERHFFETKQEAKNFADEQIIRIENFGVQGGGILTPSQTEQAKNAFELLAPHGITLNEVVADWIARKQARELTVTFSVAGEYFQNYLIKRRIKGRPVSDAYKKTVRQTLARFSALDSRLLSELDARTLDEASKGMTASVKNTALAVLSALFSWCMETPRHWIAENPAKAVPRESTGGGEVHTFTVAAADKVLVQCGQGDLLPYHVLGFFAGIRPEELKRTRWDFINLEEMVIVLPADVSKTNARRVIEITDTLAAWLRWYIEHNGIQQGLIVSSVNLRKRLRALRDDAGVEWIQDGMRHTYASNWLSIHKDEHRLRDNLGHKSADELWDHYHKATTQKEAAAFWALTPSALASGNVIDINAEVAA